VNGRQPAGTDLTVEGRVPMMARAGDEQTYLLGFKNAHRARKFLEVSPCEGAEPRMVVKSNKDALLRVARAQGVVGVLVDYDPQTRDYAAATAL
jgi:hypothetical protein